MDFINKHLKFNFALFLIVFGLSYAFFHLQNLSLLFAVLVLIGFVCTTIDALRQSNLNEEIEHTKARDSISSLEEPRRLVFKNSQIWLLVCAVLFFVISLCFHPDAVNNILTIFGLAIYFVVGVENKEVKEIISKSWPLWLVIILQCVVLFSGLKISSVIHTQVRNLHSPPSLYQPLIIWLDIEKS